MQTAALSLHKISLRASHRSTYQTRTTTLSACKHRPHSPLTQCLLTNLRPSTITTTPTPKTASPKTATAYPRITSSPHTPRTAAGSIPRSLLSAESSQGLRGLPSSSMRSLATTRLPRQRTHTPQSRAVPQSSRLIWGSGPTTMGLTPRSITGQGALILDLLSLKNSRKRPGR